MAVAKKKVSVKKSDWNQDIESARIKGMPRPKAGGRSSGYGVSKAGKKTASSASKPRVTSTKSWNADIESSRRKSMPRPKMGGRSSGYGSGK